MNDIEREISELGIDDIDSLRPLVDAFVQSHPSIPFRDGHWAAFRHWLTRVVHDDHAVCFVAKAGTGPVGFIMGDIRENAPVLLPEKIGHISVLIVDGSSRSQGIGDKLWKEVHRWFVSNGIDHFELYTEYGNTISGPFWQKRGFEIFLEKRRLR